MEELSHEIILDNELTQVYFDSIDAENQLIPLHWHNHLEILIVQEGILYGYVNEQSYKLTPGDVLIVNPKDIHYTHMRGRVYYDLLQISEVHLKRIRKDWQLIHFQEYLPKNEAISAIFSTLKHLLEEHKPGNQLLFLAQIYQLFYLLYTNSATILTIEDRNQTDRDLKRIELCMQYVRKNYQKSITLSDISDLLSLSPEYFCRLFKKYTGQSFLTYVNQIRMYHFHEELLHTNESITYLLEKNGITSYKVFMKQFKSTYTKTPYILRKEFNAK